MGHSTDPMNNLAQNVDSLSIATDPESKQVVKLIRGKDVRPQLKALKNEGKLVQLTGSILSVRESRKIKFFDLSLCRAQVVQCVLEASELPKDFIAGSTFKIVGKVQWNDRNDTPEIIVQEWTLLGGCPQGGLKSVINRDTTVGTLRKYRHLALREPKYAVWIMLKHIILEGYRKFCIQNEGMVEVVPPVTVKYKGEGGSEVFGFDYFGQNAYLSQTSQFYLEAAVPSIGSCFCILPSFRAEKSRTPRHLTEFTHAEAELAFTSFDDLLVHLESVVRAIYKHVEGSGILEQVKELHKDAKILKLSDEPFTRMTYREYVEELKKYDIKKEDGSYYSADEDVPSKPEREFCDRFGKPLFITKFPRHLKAFYMPPDEEDPSVTLSVDLCLPGVGEVVGGSVRMVDPAMVQEAVDKETGKDSNEEMSEERQKAVEDMCQAFTFYKDLRTYGSFHTAGYGLGISRLVMIFGCKTIQDSCLFPRTSEIIYP